jgi:hypothetical protein
VLAAYPNFELSAVNPGRAVFGLLEGLWKTRLVVSPAIAAVKSRVIQVAEFTSGPGKYAAQAGAARSGAHGNAEQRDDQCGGAGRRLWRPAHGACDTTGIVVAETVSIVIGDSIHDLPYGSGRLEP